MEKAQIIRLLQDCAESISDSEYNRWYNTNTTMSFEEWQSKYSKELIERCNNTINVLED